MSFCCSSKIGKKRLQQTMIDIKQKVSRIRKLKMNDDQIYEFTERFESQSVNHRMSLKNYKESLGLIGTDSLSFMADRMFQVMDKKHDGCIMLDEYLCYIDIMLYGTEEEKRKQSFGLLDKRGEGNITFDDFKSIVQSFAQMWSAALGTPVPLNLKYFQTIFNDMASGKPYFNLQDFDRYVQMNPEALNWFSKPESALQSRVNDYKNKKQKEKQVLIDQIDDLKQKVASHIISFQDSLCSSLDVIDPRYNGNAKQILLREESVNANTNNNLDMIGETPNPDDEETFRNNKFNKDSPSDGLQNQTSSIKLINQFVIEEEKHFYDQASSRQQQPFAEAEADVDYGSRQQETQVPMPSLVREPRHFIKMQKAVQARGEQNQEDWIEKRISELQQRNTPNSQQAKEPSSLLFTGTQMTKIIEFPRVPHRERKIENGAKNNNNTTDNHGRTIFNNHYRAVGGPADYNSEFEDSRAMKPQNSQVYFKDQNQMFDNKLNRLARTGKSENPDQHRLGGQKGQNSPSAHFNDWFNQQSQSGEYQAQPMDFNSADFRKNGNQDEFAPSGVTINKFYDNNQNDQNQASDFDRASLQEEDQAAVQYFEGGSSEELSEGDKRQNNFGQEEEEAKSMSFERRVSEHDSNNLYEQSLQFDLHGNTQKRHQGQRSPTQKLMYESNDGVRIKVADRKRAMTFGNQSATHIASRSNEDNNSQKEHGNKLRQLTSIHKQDQGLPGNFYYLRSNENIVDQSQEQLVSELEQEEQKKQISSEADQQEDLTVEKVYEFNNSIIKHQQSQKSDNPSEDFENEIERDQISQQEKSLIERYKKLEFLMKKKKMMTQIEEEHNENFHSGQHQHLQINVDDDVVSIKNHKLSNNNQQEDIYNKSIKFDLNESKSNIDMSHDLSVARSIKIMPPNSSVKQHKQNLIQLNVSQLSPLSSERKSQSKPSSPDQKKSGGFFGRPFSSFLNLANNNPQNLTGQDQQDEEEHIAIEIEAEEQDYGENLDLESDARLRPEKPQIGGAISLDQVNIQFDDSQEYTHKKNYGKFDIAQSADELLIRNSEFQDLRFKKHQNAQTKKIAQLELELELAKERMMIGSQIINNLVKDTKNSLKYVIQSFELITKQSNANDTVKGMRVKDIVSITKQYVHESVSQNVPKKIPKLITKNQSSRSLKEINNQSGKNDSNAQQQIEEENGEDQLPIVKYNAIIYGNKSKSVKENPTTRNFIHPAHHNFNMVFNIMLGIKMSVDCNLDLPMFTPTDKDYKIKCEFGVAPYKTDNSDLVKACTFFDYAPKIFASIRKFSGVSKEQYLESLGPEKILSYIFKSNFQTLSELCSSGKSGSFFYYSYDGKFMLKTIPRREFKMMKGMLKNYHEYLTERNTDSMISRVFGLHKVIFYRKRGKKDKKIYFCVMNNVFQTTKKIDQRYDLKGSTWGRQTIKDKVGVKVDPTVALKDLDFLSKKEEFKVGHENKRRIMNILQQDAQFFAQQNIIDYSLLVGIHNRTDHPSTFLSRRDSQNEQMQFEAAGTPVDDASPLNTLNAFDMQSMSNMEDHRRFYQQYDGGLLSSDQQHIYYMGVIDIFTGYTVGKKFEHFGKSIFQNRSTISCVPPQRYAQRFTHFLQNTFR